MFWANFIEELKAEALGTLEFLDGPARTLGVGERWIVAPVYRFTRPEPTVYACVYRWPRDVAGRVNRYACVELRPPRVGEFINRLQRIAPAIRGEMFGRRLAWTDERGVHAMHQRRGGWSFLSGAIERTPSRGIFGWPLRRRYPVRPGDYLRCGHSRCGSRYVVELNHHVGVPRTLFSNSAALAELDPTYGWWDFECDVDDLVGLARHLAEHTGLPLSEDPGFDEVRTPAPPP